MDGAGVASGAISRIIIHPIFFLLFFRLLLFTTRQLLALFGRHVGPLSGQKFPRPSGGPRKKHIIIEIDPAPSIEWAQLLRPQMGHNQRRIEMCRPPNICVIVRFSCHPIRSADKCFAVWWLIVIFRCSQSMTKPSLVL